MVTRWKKVIALVGLSALLVSQNSAMTVFAGTEQEVSSEQGSGDGNKTEGETGNGEDGNKTESETGKGEEESGAESETGKGEGESGAEEENGISIQDDEQAVDELQAATDLSWSTTNPGTVVFTNPNGAVKVLVGVFKDGSTDMFAKAKFEVDDNTARVIQEDFAIYLTESGSYTFKVKFFKASENMDEDWTSGCIATCDSAFEYTLSTEKLSVPSDIKFDKDAVASWSGVDHAKEYVCQLFRYYTDSEGNISRSEFVTEKILSSDVTTYDFKSFVYTGTKFGIKVKAVSENINNYADSEYSELVKKDEDNSTSDSNAEVKAATDLRWSDEIPGRAIFYNPNEENVGYIVQLYKNGNSYGSWYSSAYGAGDIFVRLNQDMMESAEYTYQVKIFPYGVEKVWESDAGCASEISSVFNYTRPSESVGVPDSIEWSGDGKVSWSAVEHADYYVCYLYYKDSGDSEYTYVSGRGSYSTELDWSDYIAKGHDYYTLVRAYSENINLYANGENSDYIPYGYSKTIEKVNNTLDDALGTDSDSELSASQKLNNIKNSFNDETTKKELQIAMQADEDTQNKIENLEKDYKDEMNLTTGVETTDDLKDLGINDSNVSLRGAALNATQNGGTVTFKLSKPDEETQKNLVTNTRFTKAIVLDLSLEGAGIEKGQDLAIPVTVTMPAPEGINIDKLTVLHYNADNTKYETLTVRKNSDGTISFTVTHFSNFVFAEEETASSSISNNGNDSSSDESNYTSSDDGASSSSSSVVATPVKQPTIGTSKGWSAISSEVDKAIAKLTAGDTTPAIVSVNLNGVETIPATAISAIAGKNVILSIFADANTLITIDGSQLTALDASDVKLISKKDADGKTALNVRTQNLNLEKSIVVYSNVGIDKAGSVATLYFENADKSLLEFRTSPVFENGYAAFITPFVNANYKISIQ
jgi:hypothetical protein